MTTDPRGRFTFSRGVHPPDSNHLTENKPIEPGPPVKELAIKAEIAHDSLSWRVDKGMNPVPASGRGRLFVSVAVKIGNLQQGNEVGAVLIDARIVPIHKIFIGDLRLGWHLEGFVGRSPLLKQPSF